MKTKPQKLSEALEAMKLEGKQHVRLEANKRGCKDPKGSERSP
jgi:hypothetical protein